jgi:tetratricopeptide (TPR) repeat protein
MSYYYKAINTLRGSKDSIELAAAISNAGDEFVKVKLYDSALYYFKEAKIIYDKIKHLHGQAYSFGNIGTVYDHIGKYDLAEENLNKALKMLGQTEDYYAICDFLLPLSDAYAKNGDTKTGISYAARSLQLAKQYGLKEQIGNANEKLSELYETSGDMGQSLYYYKDFIAYRDSINNLASVTKMFNLRFKYEVGEKDAEVKLLNQQKRNQKILVFSLGVILTLTVLILAILIRSSRNRKKAYTKLEERKLKMR